jgi:hypothetical protein
MKRAMKRKVLRDVTRTLQFGNPATSATLRCRCEGNKVVIMAAPYKGEPGELGALRVVAHIDKMLTEHDVPHHVYTRSKYVEGKGKCEHADVVWLRRSKVPFILYPFLPPAILAQLP